MGIPLSSRSLRAVAAIQVGDGRVLFSTGSGGALAALSSASLPPSSWVTDPEGRRLSSDELPHAAARAGRAYPPRELQVWRNGAPTVVVAAVSLARLEDGGDAEVALLTVEPRTDTEGASARAKFLTIATHELRSPITSLQLDLERLRRRMSHTETVRGADVAKDMERAMRQVTRLTLLIQNLLDVTRMQTRQFTLASDAEEADFCSVIKEMVETLRPQVAAAGCELVVAPCEPVIGIWDQVRVEQVLHNLVTNAVKYGSTGKRIDIRVEHDVDAHMARLTVRDYGPGVDPEDRLRIFEPFERGHAEGDAVTSHSLGLGLYIVREIVAAHGGSIRVESPVGGGASFVVELPIRWRRGEKEDGEEEDQ